MKKFEKVFEKKVNGKIEEKLNEKGEIIYKTKRALRIKDVIQTEDNKFQEVSAMEIDEFGGITLMLKEI